MGKLHRKWRSTSDFEPAPGLSVCRRPGPSLSVRPPSPGGRAGGWSREEGALRLARHGRNITVVCPPTERATYCPDRPGPAPKETLRLEWVYGYRGREGRANLHLLPTGEAVYPVAATVVLLHTEEHTQRHYLAHTEEVRCIAVHPSRLTVATGQGGATYRREGEPCVRLWSAVSLATLHVLPAGGLARAVACLSFSKTDGGVFLAAVEEGPEHTLAVWDWARNARAAEARSSSETVVALEFHPVEDGAVVTCGRGHVTFWQLETGLGTLARRTGVLEPRDKPKYFTCLAFSSAGDLITGDSSGNVLVWGRGYNAVTQALWAVHEGPVFLVCVLRDGSLVTGGGRDRRLLRLDPEYRPTGELALLPEALGGPRALAQAGGGTLLLGTTAGSILRGSFGLGFQPVAASPGGEARAVAARPGTTQFLTGGTQLRLWDSLTHSLVWSHDPGEGAEAAAFSADGELVVVGMAGGRWLVLDARTREVVEEHQAGTEPLTSVAFSPHGGRLAVGSRGAVHLYTPGEDGRFLRAGRCAGAPGPLLPGLDWAEDGSRVMASTPEGEVVWDAALCRLLAEAGDLAWASSSAPLSWRTVAAWAEGPGPPTATCSSPGGRLLAAGTEAGELLLLSHPACQPAAAGPALPAHSGPVTRLVFLGEPAGLRLITAGLDGALLQWRVGAD